MEATDSAIEALSRAYRLAPENEEIATTYAQTSFFVNEGQLDANIRRVLQDYIAKNPQHERAQMLMAMGEHVVVTLPKRKVGLNAYKAALWPNQVIILKL